MCPVSAGGDKTYCLGHPNWLVASCFYLSAKWVNLWNSF